MMLAKCLTSSLFHGDRFVRIKTKTDNYVTNIMIHPAYFSSDIKQDLIKLGIKVLVEGTQCILEKQFPKAIHI